MGGFGSGRYPRRGIAKTTVDRCRVLDVNDLNREGLLAPGASGTATWTRTRDGEEEEVASIGYRRTSMPEGEDALTIYYTITRRDDETERVEYRAPLTYTECNFGGERPWFVCPGIVNDTACERRVGKLYKPPGADLFLCRHCHDLAYESSQKSGKPFYENLMKPLERAERTREALKGNPFDRERLKACYEAQRAVDEGMIQEFDVYGSTPPRTVPPTFEEWADNLFTRALGGYGHFGRCNATAKTTGERCRQSATGEHGKCYYHGGAPGSGIGEDQRDHAAEYVESLIQGIEEDHRKETERTEALLDGLED